MPQHFPRAPGTERDGIISTRFVVVKFSDQTDARARISEEEPSKRKSASEISVKSERRSSLSATRSRQRKMPAASHRPATRKRQPQLRISASAATMHSTESA